MDIRKTEEYYAALTPDDICQCDYCRNFTKAVRLSYPAAATYLAGIGADIEKPFELFPLDPGDEENITYLDVQYIVMGSSDDFKETQAGGVRFAIAASHPLTGIAEEHFVIEADSFTLKWPGRIRRQTIQ